MFWEAELNQRLVEVQQEVNAGILFLVALGLVLKLEDILVGAFGTLHEYERLALLDGHLEKF